MRIAQEPDRLNGRFIVIVAILAVAITALGVIIAWLLRESARSPIGAPASFEAKRAGKPPEELSGVEMIVFPRDGRAAGSSRESNGPASTAAVPASAPYGWSDRERRTVYVPIERAKELYLSRQRAAAATAKPAGGRP